MFVQDVMERIDNKEWKKLSMGELLSTQTQDDDTLRLTREEPREDPLEDQFETVDEFKIVWVS